MITATAPRVAAAAAIGAMLLPLAAKAGRAVVGYVDREFIQQRNLAPGTSPASVWGGAGVAGGPVTLGA